MDVMKMSFLNYASLHCCGNFLLLKHNINVPFMVPLQMVEVVNHFHLQLWQWIKLIWFYY